MDYKEYFNFWKSSLRKTELWTQSCNSVFEIDYDSLMKEEIKLLIFDVDDTLTFHHSNISSKVINFLGSLKESFFIALYSNRGPKRLSDLKKQIPNLYLQITSDKPGRKGFENILSHFKVEVDKAVMIGDRPGTDMWGAYRSGLRRRILVKPYKIKADLGNVLIALLRKIELIKSKVL